jgi:ribosomal-protein-alanine N-acetyltransferase
MLELLNQEAFLLNIGDRRVRSLADAAIYILDGPVASYQTFGFGLYAAEERSSGKLAGICGLLKRESLDAPDLGFAFLQRFWGQGYALESAEAVVRYARNSLGLRRIVALTKPANRASIKLLEKIGFRFETRIQRPGEEGEIRLFSSEA